MLKAAVIKGHSSSLAMLENRFVLQRYCGAVRRALEVSKSPTIWKFSTKTIFRCCAQCSTKIFPKMSIFSSKINILWVLNCQKVIFYPRRKGNMLLWWGLFFSFSILVHFSVRKGREGYDEEVATEESFRTYESFDYDDSENDKLLHIIDSEKIVEREAFPSFLPPLFTYRVVVAPSAV